MNIDVLSTAESSVILAARDGRPAPPRTGKTWHQLHRWGVLLDNGALAENWQAILDQHRRASVAANAARDLRRRSLS